MSYELVAALVGAAASAAAFTALVAIVWCVVKEEWHA